MMDEKGNLLYHPTQPSMVGRNLYKTDSSCFKCHNSFDVEKKIIEGKRRLLRTGTCRADRRRQDHSPFLDADVGDSRWIVAISAPYSEMTIVRSKGP